MCNALVCLAVWMCYGARTTIDKIVAIDSADQRHSSPPASSTASPTSTIIPMGLFIKAGAPNSFWTSIGKTPADFPQLTWSNFFFANLLPVTIGNIIGGSVMVGAVYWFVYLRNADPFKSRR